MIDVYLECMGVAIVCMVAIVICAIARGCMGKDISKFADAFTQTGVVASAGIWLYCVLRIIGATWR